MKQLFGYITVLCLIFFASSCADDFAVETPSFQGNGIRIVGAPEPYDNRVVTTRANSDMPDDLFISGMTLFIFDSEGNLIPAYLNRNFTQLSATSAITIKKSNPTFLIDKSSLADDYIGIIASLDGESSREYYFKSNDPNLAACEIYIVANLWHTFSANYSEELKKIKTKADLLNYIITIDNTLSMPKNPETGEWVGFPMIGTTAPDTNGNPTTFNLMAGGGNANAVATIPMKKLYSKIDFYLSVKANQIIENGDKPKFQIEKVEVFNIPTLARMDGHGVIDEDVNNDAASDYVNNAQLKVAAEAKGIEMYQFMDPSLNDEMTGETCNGSFTITDFNRRITQHDVSNNPSYIEFGFYMPEHYVKPHIATIRPPIDEANMTEAERSAYYQQMKPLHMRTATIDGDGVRTYSENKKATFIRLHGRYTDHHGQIHNVAYDVYLGHNNSNDFNIERNCQLSNYLTITGITNNNQAGDGTISLDHRVNVADAGYVVAQEREALLDAHFEVRPLDITLSGGSKMKITIPESCKDWISVESDDAAASRNEYLYCNNADHRRVRRYFTTNLISELNGDLDDENGAEVLTLDNTANVNKSKTFRLWFYIDENPNVYDKTGKGKQSFETGNYTVSNLEFRNAVVDFSYQKNGVEEGKSEINFQQHNLWRVWNNAGNRFYDIEVEEEYLNNYASDAGYGETQNGMPWGLDGVPLSNKYKAAFLENSSGSILGWILGLFGTDYDEWLNGIISKSGIAPYYDFYLTRDSAPTGSTIRSYCGYTFSTEILTTLRAQYAQGNDEKYKVDGIYLTENPKSAFAYCMHKNKRDADGKVAALNWYMPAIDEIEEIAMGAYDQFGGVFQDNLYWSSQPAYFNKILRLDRPVNIIISRYEEHQYGDYMDDDTGRARATKVVFDPTHPSANTQGYVNVSSAVSGTEGTYVVQIDQFRGNYIPPGQGTGYDGVGSGYVKNTNNDNLCEEALTSYDGHKGNVPRTESCRIRAVYRSSENIKAAAAAQ